MRLAFLIRDLACSAILGLPVFGQGTFQNLDFEAAQLVPVTNHSSLVAAPAALPGWRAYVGANAVNWIGYNAQTIDAADVSIHDVASPSVQPLSGNFSVLLQGTSYSPGDSAAIAQTGQIPANAMSIRFLVGEFRGNFLLPSLTFNGEDIPLAPISSNARLIVAGGDISAFAGQTGELRFTAVPRQAAFFDAIRFSTLPIPEPSIVGLTALGAGFFGWYLRRRREVRR